MSILFLLDLILIQGVYILLKKSVLELILVIHPAGAYHVFPEHEVTKSITTPTLDGMPVHHKGTPCQTMLRIC